MLQFVYGLRNRDAELELAVVQTQEYFLEDFSSRNVVFALSAIGLAGKLAAADGPVNLMEVGGFLRIFNIEEQQREQKLHLFFSASRDDSGVRVLCNFIRKSYPGSRELLKQLIDKLVKVADSDSFIQEREYAIIKEIADLTGIGEGYMQGVLWRHYTTPRMPFQSMLGLGKKYTVEDVKNSYRKMSRELHPDVYSAKKYAFLSQLASARFSAITEAYRRLTA